MTCAAHSNAELWLSWLLYIVEVSISNLQRLIRCADPKQVLQPPCVCSRNSLTRTWLVLVLCVLLPNRDDHKTPHAVQHSPAAAAAAAAVTPWTQLSPHLLAVLTNTKTDLTAIIAAAWMQRQAQVPSPPRTPCPAATALPLFQAKQPRIVLGHLTHSPPRLNLASLHSVLRHTSSAQRGLQQLYLHMLQTRQQQAQLLLGDRSDKGAGQDPAAHTALQQWQPNPLWELDNNSEQGEEEKNAQELGTPQPSVPTFETAVSPSPPPCVPAGSLRDTAAAQPVSGLPPGDHNAFDWFCPTCALPATQLMVALVDADTRVAAARAQLAAAQGDINRLLGESQCSG